MTIVELTDAELDQVTGGGVTDLPANGTTVAEANGIAGPFGASGNVNASAGPGYFLKQGTSEAVLTVLSTGILPT